MILLFIKSPEGCKIKLDFQFEGLQARERLPTQGNRIVKFTISSTPSLPAWPHRSGGFVPGSHPGSSNIFFSRKTLQSKQLAIFSKKVWFEKTLSVLVRENIMQRNVFIISFLLMGLLSSCSSGNDWRTASRESAGIAPDPATTQEAILHVYGADAWGWRGWFAIHTWIAAKRSGENVYTVYDVIGWRSHRNNPVLKIYRDVPDRYWFGERPRLLVEHRGLGVDNLIEAVDNAAREYPWKTTYKAFPGPNSNTFTAWVAAKVPELELTLPFSAIGSGYVNEL